MKLLDHTPVGLTVTCHCSANIHIHKPIYSEDSLSGNKGAEACHLMPFEAPLGNYSGDSGPQKMLLWLLIAPLNGAILFKSHIGFQYNP